MDRGEKLIHDYIAAYNAYDVEGMTAGMASDMVFVNIQGGDITLRLEGVDAFRRQAEEAKSYFSSRKQKINHIVRLGETYEVEIDYEAVLAVDLPNGLSQGKKLCMTGKSIFRIEKGQIVNLTDIS
ncbi:nuclear transport factor 2 family protein [Lunatimonas salinarum]|uniref:nuclear transport factor 2 family protein n=1 Tax=Lunatimonas salinarum TaxID=1774590 RepID=UPI001AE0671A|nr:nuclear transport factor 2 family protein [Lunatimonas salinarum]